MSICLGTQSQPCLWCSIAAVPYLFYYRRIVVGVAHDGNVLPIFCCRPQHRWSADVDIFDSFFHNNSFFADGLGERVEIDAYQVDKLYFVTAESCQVFGVVALGEQPAVNFRVEGFYSAVAYLGKTRNLTDVYYLYTRVLQQLHSAARGYYFPPRLSELSGKIYNTPLVAYTE